MRYEVVLGKKFDRQTQKFIKEYPDLKESIFKLSKELAINPRLGTCEVEDFLYKIPLDICRKSKGKSSDEKVISTWAIIKDSVLLINIYSIKKHKYLTLYTAN